MVADERMCLSASPVHVSVNDTAPLGQSLVTCLNLHSPCSRSISQPAQVARPHPDPGATLAKLGRSATRPRTVALPALLADTATTPRQSAARFYEDSELQGALGVPSKVQGSRSPWSPFMFVHKPDP